MARPKTPHGGGHTTSGSGGPNTGGHGGDGTSSKAHNSGDADSDGSSSRPRFHGSGEVPKNMTRAQAQTAELAQRGRPGANRQQNTDSSQQGHTDDGATTEQDPRQHPNDHDTPAQDRACTGDPVDVVSGDVFMTQTDVALPGVLPLILERTHVSSYRKGRAFGHSWASTLDMRLELDADGGAVLVTADGMLLVYPHTPAAGVAFPTTGPRLGLAPATGGGYTVTDTAAGTAWHFAGPQRSGATAVPGVRRLPLAAITHRCGDRIDLIPDHQGQTRQVVHSGGYRVLVDWDQDRVTRLSLHDPTIATPRTLVRFGYVTNGRLLGQVTNASGLPLRFEYDPAGRLARWVDRNQHWYAYAYDPQGRCVAATGSDGFLTTDLTYHPDQRTTTATDALGHTTTYVHGEHKKVIRETDPTGAVTLREWDTRGRLLAVTDPTGAVTRYTYDQHGNLIHIAGPDGTTATATYTSDQLPASVTGPDGARRSYTYDGRGNVLTATDPIGAVTTYAYDQTGHLASVTDPLGTTTTVVPDGAGLPVQTIDAAGATTAYTRDSAGRVIRVTDALGATTTLSYTPGGRLAARTGPDGSVESWEYDSAGHLAVHTSPVGATTRFEYTAFDQPTARTNPDGTRLEFAYDAQLRLTRVTNPQGLTWLYRYDPAGRLTAETDFNGRTLAYTYDLAGRLVAHTNGLGQTTHLVRDHSGNPIERHAAEGTTRFVYDPAGRLLRATSPIADLILAYDPAGRLTSETVDGRTITFAYDLAGRRTSRTTPTGAISTWAYEGPYGPTSLTTDGRTLTFTHDLVGNLIERHLETSTGWQALRQSYDQVGRLVTQTLQTSALASGQVPDPAPAGGEISSRVVAHRSYVYRADGFLTATTDLTGGLRTLDLDPVGRITAVTAANWAERYAYDTAGNLTAANWTTPPSPVGGDGIVAGSSVAESGIDAQGARIYAGTLIRSAGRYRFEHDPQGRVVLRQRAQHSGKPLTWRYAWDSDDRLIWVQTPAGICWSYRYDPLGRRLGKYRHAPDGSIAEQTDFTWDRTRLVEQAHHRHQASVGPEVTTWDYQPGSYSPIVQYERHWLATAPQPVIDQRFYTIVTDLTGTPTHLADANGQIVWETLQTVWGTETTVSRTGTICPIRLPGQYHDPETGHHYNNQRYYDPTTARYLSQDPLGLVPAPNPTAYVLNPTYEIDPVGLAPVVEPTPQQIHHAMQNVAGLTEVQARMIMTAAFSRGSSVVFGGSRVRGNYGVDSDVDVGFGGLTSSQAGKIIQKVNKIAAVDPTFLKMEETRIVPGNETPRIPKIISPEEFFDRSGVRVPEDKGGAPFAGSGSHTYSPNGSISSRCPK